MVIRGDKVSRGVDGGRIQEHSRCVGLFQAETLAEFGDLRQEDRPIHLKCFGIGQGLFDIGKITLRPEVRAACGIAP